MKYHELKTGDQILLCGQVEAEILSVDETLTVEIQANA